MELQVRTLQGTAKLQVLADTSVLDLKRQLHQQYSSTLDVPEPGRQRLVYKDSVLSDAESLEAKGVTEGDAVVLLPLVTLPKPPEDTTPVPTAASIRDAIYAEARARGTEHTLKEEPQRQAPDIGRRIMELLEQALGGLQLPPGAAAGGVEGMAPLAEAAAALAQASLQMGPGMVPPVVIQGAGAAPQQAHQPAAPPAPEPPLQVPEPRADQIATLTDMGFSEAVARKALLLTRCNVELALEWVLQHMDDPDAETPPTQEQLRQVYGPRRAAAPTPEALTQTLMDMGFSQAAASGALRRFGNMEAALAFLLTGAGGQAAPAAAVAAAGADGAASAAGAANGGTAAGDGAEAAGGAGSSAGGAQTGPSSSQSPSAAAAAAGDAGPSSHAVQQLDEEAGSQDEEGGASPEEDEEEEEEEEEYDYEEEGQEGGEEEDTYGEEEDEFEDLDDELARQLPLHLEDALDGMGSMDLATLGSANMEQLLQGASMEELYGHQLLMNPEAVDISSQQEALQRIADIAAMLQQAMGANAAAAGAAGGGAAQGGAGGEADGAGAPGGGAAGSRGASRGSSQGA